MIFSTLELLNQKDNMHLSELYVGLCVGFKLGVNGLIRNHKVNYKNQYSYCLNERDFLLKKLRYNYVRSRRHKTCLNLRSQVIKEGLGENRYESHSKY